MKKNLVPKKKRDFYLHYFLPKIEVILTLKKMHGKDLVLNQQSLAEYFDIDRREVSDYLKQAELDGLIIFDKKTTKIDDTTVQFAMKRYTLPEASEDSKYYSKLQEYINDYMYWAPDFGNRLDFYFEFLDKIERSEVEHSIRSLEKEERALRYAEKYQWTLPIMDNINATRPDKLKSTYLADGKLRESNYLCHTLNPEKEHKNMKLFYADLSYRTILLEEFFGTRDFVECDTNGSIYRLSYNLTHDKMLSHDIDIYQEFWRLAGFKGELDRVSRDGLKLLCMIIFMSNAAKNGYNATLAVKDDKSLTKSELQRKDIINYLSKKTSLSPRVFLDSLAAAMFRFLDTEEFLEEEIFIHESNLHLIILDLCEQRGIQVINVYDGFYFKRCDMTQQQYQALYDEATTILKQLE